MGTTLVKVENGDHIFLPNPPEAMAKPSGQEIMQMTMDFFDKHLIKGSTS